MTKRQPDGDGRLAAGAARTSPPAPGGSISPQQPGMTPDRSGVPGQFGARVGRATSKRRPLAQYGTAEEIMKVYKRSPEDQITPRSFEQATASFEELRKANPADLSPVRPRQSEIGAGTEAEALPAGTAAT